MTDSIDTPGTVFIAENTNEVGNPNGRVSVHWESAVNREMLRGPEDATVDDALEWGRRHASVVLIRPADSDVLYSAGPVNPVPAECPPWPAGRTLIPRPRSRHWWAAILIPESDQWTATETDRLVGLLRRSPRIDEVGVASGAAQVECRVRADSGSEALDVIHVALPDDVYDGHLPDGYIRTTSILGPADSPPQRDDDVAGRDRDSPEEAQLAEFRCRWLVEAIEQDLDQRGEWVGYGGNRPDGTRDPGVDGAISPWWEHVLAKRSERLHRQFHISLLVANEAPELTGLVSAFIHNVDGVDGFPPEIIFPSLALAFGADARTLETASRLLRRWMHPDTSVDDMLALLSRYPGGRVAWEDVS